MTVGDPRNPSGVRSNRVVVWNFTIIIITIIKIIMTRKLTIKAYLQIHFH